MPLDAGLNFALPDDAQRALLIGRIWRPDVGGPAVVAVRDGAVIDISKSAPTIADLCEGNELLQLARDAGGQNLGPLQAILANTPRDRLVAGKPWLLAPVDLQAIKAAGVTFAISMLERVIEEQARGDKERAVAL